MLQRALSFSNVAVSYGGIEALRNLTLSIEEHSIYAVLGPNGAGKSTLANATGGRLKLSAGSISFFGEDVTAEDTATRVSRGIALVPEGRQLFPRLTVRQNLDLGSRKSDRDHILQQIFELFPNLSQRQSQLAGTMSGGEQQMLAIGRALMSQPRVLLLDEPSAGLAPSIIDSVFERIVTIRDEGATIVLVEQNVKAALGIADRVAFLNAGKHMAVRVPEEVNDDDELAQLYFAPPIDQ